MPTPGYPDYQRLSLQGGVLLGSISQKVNTSGVEIFQGYLGSLPYFNVFFSTEASNGIYQIQVGYYTDDTFTTQIAAQDITVGLTGIGVNQFPTLSPWVVLFIVGGAGSNDNPVFVSAYGTTAHNTAYELNQLAGALLAQTGVPVGINTSVPINATHWFTGRVLMTVGWNSAGTPKAGLQYYDWNSASWLYIFNDWNANFGKTMSLELPAPAAPLRVNCENTSTTAALELFPALTALPG